MGWTVAVTGASGYLGQFVVADLLGRGHRVRAWRRANSHVDGFPFADAIEWIEGGLGDATGDQGLLRGADALVHLAFAHVEGRYRGGEGDDLDGFYRHNLDGSRRLLAAARKLDVPRCVFLSSRAVYGKRLWDRPLDEHHPTAPDSYYGAYKLAVEAELAAHAAVDGWHTASLRCTGIYGEVVPAKRSKWASIIEDVVAGRRHGQSRGGTEVHGADVADAIVRLLENPLARGQSFVCSDVFVTTRAVARIAAPGAPALWPASPHPPLGVLHCAALHRLGWQPRGWPGVVACVEGMVRRSG